MKEINGPERTYRFGEHADIITFRNDTQTALWDNELSGQISDGMWENAKPRDHWQVWCRATAVTADPDMKLGRNFPAIKDNYSLNSSFLLECVGQRMIEEVERDTGTVLTMKQLRAELADMKKIMKTFV